MLISQTQSRPKSGDADGADIYSAHKPHNKVCHYCILYQKQIIFSRSWCGREPVLSMCVCVSLFDFAQFCFCFWALLFISVLVWVHVKVVAVQ